MSSLIFCLSLAIEVHGDDAGDGFAQERRTLLKVELLGSGAYTGKESFLTSRKIKSPLINKAE